ncbi:MAG: extracellular solute-binding protein [Anaeromyxobacter sp.]
MRHAALAGLLCASAACTGGHDAVPTLRWYANPDNGGQARLAARCEAAAGGRFRIRLEELPRDATGQREQLVRRLAAHDASIDLLSLDPPFLPELAEAGFLRAFAPAEAAPLEEGTLEGPLTSARWRGRLYGAPFTANAQVLWFRRSAAARAGLDAAVLAPLTWDAIVLAAERSGTTVAVQGRLYEGYTVWLSALVASGGGAVLEHPEAGREARPRFDSSPGREAARIVSRVARSPAAMPGLSTADEEATRAAFLGPRGGFMVNWPYVWRAASEAVRAGALDPAVLADVGWARWPRVRADLPSRPPLGGIHLAVGAFSRHPAEAVEAVRCLTSAASQVAYMLDAGNPAARGAAYDDPAVRAAYPMAELLRESVREAAPRPQTPFYPDVSAAAARAFHPPGKVTPEETPAAADRLIDDVLHDRVLL